MKTTKWNLKDGVELKPSHSLPHIVQIRLVAFATAPETTDGIMWITEAWRTARHADDAHTWCSAFDLRIHNILSDGGHREGRELEAWAWVKRMRLVHNDSRYQFDVHGLGMEKHIHAEFDPR